MALLVKNPPANAGDIRVVGSVSGLGSSPLGGNGNPLQYSCLENPIDRGTWWATVHGVAKSLTRLERLSTHAFFLSVFLVVVRSRQLQTTSLAQLALPSRVFTSYFYISFQVIVWLVASLVSCRRSGNFSYRLSSRSIEPLQLAFADILPIFGGH